MKINHLIQSSLLERHIVYQSGQNLMVEPVQQYVGKKSLCSFLCFPLSTQLSNSLVSRWNSLDLLDTGSRDPASMNLCPNPNSLKSFMEMARFCKKTKKKKRHETSYMQIIAVLTILSTTSEPSRKWKHISKVVE